MPVHLPTPLRSALTALLLTATLSPGMLAQGAYPNYYPHQIGIRWTYTSGESQVVGAPITVKGVKVTPVNHLYGSTTYSQDLLEYRADGSVWLRGVSSGGRLVWYNPPINVYPAAPLSPGKSWQSVTANLRISNLVTGIAPVRTSAGNFNALVIRTDTNAGGKTSTQLTYFVPSVGVVRYETADGSRIDLQR